MFFLGDSLDLISTNPFTFVYDSALYYSPSYSNSSYIVKIVLIYLHRMTAIAHYLKMSSCDSSVKSNLQSPVENWRMGKGRLALEKPTFIIFLEFDL